jgi:multimeric flavodoxin WrbA
MMNKKRGVHLNYLILSGNPKKDGLCDSVLKNVIRGAKDAGAQVTVLTFEHLIRCQVCKGGWGTCWDERTCAFGDDGFSDAQKAVKDAGQICMITPVYWHDMAEGLKCFLDRLRRCERGELGALSGKQVLLVASAGGTGNGLVSCMEQMDRFLKHTCAVLFDCIAVNRWNNDYKKDAAYAAAYAMASGRKAGKTI